MAERTPVNTDPKTDAEYAAAIDELLGRMEPIGRSGEPDERTEVNRLQREVDQLTAKVHSLELELRRLREDEAHERELLTLRLENALLRLERRLPGPPFGELPIRLAEPVGEKRLL